MTGAELFDRFLDELAQGAGKKSLMVMIAGPNGAGKTTLWIKLVKPMLGEEFHAIYINADELERELNESAQSDPHAQQTEQTARQAQAEAARLREHLLSVPPGFQSHFVYETVFSDPHGYKLAELQKGVETGYHVVMLFVGVDNVMLAESRVRQRVAQGGHDVPSDVQQERFPRVFDNARKALQIVPLALFFDNSSQQGGKQLSHRPVAIVKDGNVLATHWNMPEWWSKITNG